jgi:heme exporter protein C
MMLSYAGILALRSFVDDPRQRASWSAIAAILATANLPIVYYSVQWWGSMHQQQSTTSTIDSSMLFPLLTNVFSLPLIAAWMVERRFRIAMRHADLESEPAEAEPLEAR